jgi:hypothetical protein
MSTKGNLTREQAVAQVGEQAVAEVNAENCDFTNRVMDGGLVEFSASVRVGNDTLTAYYYQDQSAVDAAEGLDQLNWEIEGYEIV